MPELDGLHVVRAIRAKERTAGGHLPVVALTASARQQERERCLAAGMDDFLSKPIRSAELWAAIDRVAFAYRPKARDRAGLLDAGVLWDVCGGDAVVLEKLCHTFRSRLPHDVVEVRDALRERDANRLRDSTHKLSAMLAAFSSVAGKVASELEDHAARGQLEEAGILVAELESMVKELMVVTNGLSHETLRQLVETANDPSRRAGR